MRNRDILVRIQMWIRILGSVPLTKDPTDRDADPEHWSSKKKEVTK
jgi:hypothetical protein